MIKNLLKLAAVLVVGILVYNYFMGTEAEKQQSKEIFQKVKDLGSDAWNLLKAEKEKLDEGKYDGALDKISNLIDNLKDKAEAISDSDMLDRIADLERQKDALQEKMKDAEGPDTYDNRNPELTSKNPQQDKAIKKDWGKAHPGHRKGDE
jgi:hypothetical protein